MSKNLKVMANPGDWVRWNDYRYHAPAQIVSIHGTYAWVVTEALRKPDLLCDPVWKRRRRKWATENCPFTGLQRLEFVSLLRLTFAPPEEELWKPCVEEPNDG